MFEAAKDANMERLVFISSGMVFEKAARFPCRESDLAATPAPSGLYGFSKLIGEWYCKAFHQEFGLNYSIARLYNVYGMNDASKGSVGKQPCCPRAYCKGNLKANAF